MKSKRVGIIERRLRQHRRWLAETSERFLATQRSYFELDLDEPTIACIPLMANYADSFGLVYGTRGIVGVYEDVGEAWQDIAGAIECYLTVVRLRFRPVFYRALSHRSGFQWTEVRRLPLCVTLLCYFIALGDERREREIWSLLQSSLRDTEPHAQEWWASRPFESFFAKLYAKTRGVALDLGDGKIDLGLYDEIEKHWEDDERLAVALGVACDYHLANLNNTRDRDAEFANTPMDLLPVEILAINRLRADCGLTSVAVAHPLMDQVNSLKPSPVSPELAHVVQRIEDRAAEFEA